MNMRCMYCQTMFGISRENMLIALQAMEEDNLDYFEFHPNWQEELKKAAKEAAKAEKAAAEEKPAASSSKAKAK